MNTNATSFCYTALPYRIIFAKGASDSALLRELDHFGARKIFIISSKGSLGRHQGIFEHLDAREKVLYTNIKEHVPQNVVNEATELARGAHCDLLLPIGGGSAIGIAKAVALHTGLPIVAMPTTYSGSEVTPVVGITTDGIKTTVTDSRILPKSVIYDTELTKSLSKEITFTSSYNAIAHAVGAMHTPRRNPLTQTTAIEAITRILSGLRSLLETPDSQVDFRTELFIGSLMAGTCLAQTGSSVHHKLCHLLGGTFGLPHSESHAVLLPYSLELMLEDAEDFTFRNSIRRAFGDDAVRTLREMATLYGFSSTLKDIGLDEQGLDTAANQLVEMNLDPSGTLKTTDLQHLLRRAWTGD